MNTSGARLAAITKDLWTRWQMTRESWADLKSQEFERHYLQELNFSVDKAVAVIDQLEKLLNQIRRDCE
jgi:hypothetical protein